MYTYILILEREDDTKNVFRSLATLGKVKVEPDGRHFLEAESGMANGWIAVQVAPSVEHDYDPVDLNKIKAEIAQPIFVIVEGRDETTRLTDGFIKALVPNGNALIDNDHGLVAPLGKYRELVNEGADWLNLNGVGR